MRRHFLLVVSTLLCVACSTTRLSTSRVTRDRLQAFLVQPGDLPADLAVATYDPSIADGILCRDHPGAVAASASIVTSSGLDSGYVTVVVFPSRRTAHDAVPLSRMFLDVMGNVVQRRVSLSRLGSEAYANYIHFYASKLIGPSPPQHTRGHAELRVLSRQGSILLVLALPLASDAETALDTAVPGVRRYGNALFRRVQAFTP